MNLRASYLHTETQPPQTTHTPSSVIFESGTNSNTPCGHALVHGALAKSSAHAASPFSFPHRVHKSTSNLILLFTTCKASVGHASAHS